MNLSLGHKIALGFGLALAMLLCLGLIFYRNTKLLIRIARSADHRQLVVEKLEATFHELLNAESSSRGFILTGNPSFLKTYQGSIDAVRSSLEALRRLTKDSPSHQGRLSELEPLIETKISFIKRTVDVRRAGAVEASYNLVAGGEGLWLMEDIRGLLEEMRAEEKRKLREELEMAKRAADRTNVIIIFGTGAAFAAIFLVGSIIVESITSSASKLIEATKKIGEGKLDHRLSIKARDEFGRIGESLNLMAQNLKEKQDELRRINEELEAFSYSVSHDLRAPLRHVAGFSELLMKNASQLLDEKSRRYLETISKSVKQMGTLIDDLLLFSRIGRAEMRLFPVNMDKLVRDALSDFADEVASRGAVLSIAPMPTVAGDPAMLRLVFVNLFSNALKFTRHIEKPTIEVGAELSEREAIFFVRDNGTGFDMKYADKLFGVFQRLHHQHEFEGTGIGLANVRRIIHRHGGRTWAEGAPGRGATIYFTLPLGEDKT